MENLGHLGIQDPSQKHVKSILKNDIFQIKEEIETNPLFLIELFRIFNPGLSLVLIHLK